jgi:hypothetical protein
LRGDDPARHRILRVRGPRPRHTNLIRYVRRGPFARRRKIPDAIKDDSGARCGKVFCRSGRCLLQGLQGG